MFIKNYSIDNRYNSSTLRIKETNFCYIFQVKLFLKLIFCLNSIIVFSLAFHNKALAFWKYFVADVILNITLSINQLL